MPDCEGIWVFTFGDRPVADIAIVPIESGIESFARALRRFMQENLSVKQIYFDVPFAYLCDDWAATEELLLNPYFDRVASANQEKVAKAAPLWRTQMRAQDSRLFQPNEL